MSLSKSNKMECPESNKIGCSSDSLIKYPFDTCGFGCTEVPPPLLYLSYQRPPSKILLSMNRQFK
jgi:hypothetical protein